MHRVVVLVLLLVATLSSCIDLTWLKERQKRQQLKLPVESDVEPPAESVVLRNEMVALVTELMPPQVEGAPDNGELDAELVVEEEIARTREHDPDFLIVSAELEAKLAKGQGAPDSRERVNRFLEQLDDAPLPSAAEALLKKHRSGRLSPVRTELLAQILEGVAKAQEAALIAP